jgi:hypothetical protein
MGAHASSAGSQRDDLAHSGSDFGPLPNHVPNINLHLKAIYDDGEVDEGSTIKSYLIVQTEGARKVSREVRHYNLPAILQRIPEVLVSGTR